MLNIGFIKKYRSSEIGVGGGSSLVLVYHLLLLSNLALLAPLTYFSLQNTDKIDYFLRVFWTVGFYDLPAYV